MKEKITGRVGRIISGGFHAILDAVENTAPETVLEQALREVDEAVDEVRKELGTVIANKHLANSRLLQVNQKCEDLSGKIEVAVSEKRDDLAEIAIAQQLDIEAQIPILETQISDLSSEEKDLEGYIAALRGKKNEMKEELRLFKASRKEMSNSAEAITGGGGNNVKQKVGKAETAFERVVENNAGLSMGTIATDRNTAAAMNELEELARNNRVQERLAAIKGKQGKS